MYENAPEGVSAVDMSEYMKFKYDRISRKVKVVLYKAAARRLGVLCLSEHLAYMLGFRSRFIELEDLSPANSTSDGEVWGDYMVDMSGGSNMLYVYSDIVQPQFVGDSFSPLLRLVHVEGTHGSSVEKVFFNRQYIPVMTKDFSELEIHIKTDGDNYVEFDSGKVIINLHFQLKQLLL